MRKTTTTNISIASCDVVQHCTESQRSRLLNEDEHFVAVSPYAPMFPYETWLLPKRHSSNYESIGEAEILSMARMLKLTLQKMDLGFGYPPYNCTLQTAPLGEGYVNSAHYHWYLDLVPHLATPGGFELGSGCYINSVSPEKAAEYLCNLETELK